MRTVAVIPARFASTRFPGKPLTKIAGKTMIERVYRQAKQAASLDDVLVATDDDRIYAEVLRFGGRVVMTRSDHASGTDRLAEVAQKQPDIDLIVNVQGDEPLIDPRTIDAAVAPFHTDSALQMSTVAAPLTDAAEISSPDIVKVALDRNNFALYFSRHAIPYCRDSKDEAQRTCIGHVGLYVYKRECLINLASLEQTPLERAEALEQLRALENGIGIKVVVGNYRSIAVDKPADVARVESALAGESFVGALESVFTPI